jgi:hypothetical protein
LVSTLTAQFALSLLSLGDAIRTICNLELDLETTAGDWPGFQIRMGFGKNSILKVPALLRGTLLGGSASRNATTRYVNFLLWRTTKSPGQGKCA